MRLGEQRWIEPDVTVLRRSSGQIWVDYPDVLIPVEFVSPSSRWNDGVSKPRVCAEAGVPYFMRVTIKPFVQAEVELLRLDGDRYVTHVKACEGDRFETAVPFPLSFDPADLLER